MVIRQTVSLIKIVNKERRWVYIFSADREIITALLKTVFTKGLISEITYRNSQNQLSTFDSSPFDSYSKLEQNDKKERITNGHT